MNMHNAVRPARHAGRFYTNDPAKLRSEVEGYIVGADVGDLTRCGVGFVAPHAGYAYSGATAGYVYKLLQATQPKRVFVLAPSHHAALRGASVWEGTGYETPLGEYSVDSEAVGLLKKENPDISFSAMAESEEHALEVQVPFLQVACPDAMLIPLIVGTHDVEVLAGLSDAIVSVCEQQGWEREDVALIASSDGYHGYSEAECRESDDKLAEVIGAMDQGRLFEPSPDGHPRGCGVGPIWVVMDVAKKMGATEAKVLHRTTSGKVAGHSPGQWLVGYVSAVFY